MNWLTRVFLVLLRLAIGWHFLFEGIEKLQSQYIGDTETNHPFSSVVYLRESSGPLSPFFHWQAGGDPDALALERLTLLPAEGNDESAGRLPPELARDWDEYLQRFAVYYGLTPEQRQQAGKDLQESKEKAVQWLLGKDENDDYEKALPPTPLKVKQSTPGRVADYRAAVAQIHETQTLLMPVFGKDVAKQKYRALKDDARRMRTELFADLERPMRESLAKVLSDEQKRMPPVPPAVPYQLKWTDWGISYGLTAIGACLLLGLLSRLASVLGAGFLMMLYLAMPPWPWLPENIHAEGHYLFVNKNLIEMLALLVLATTYSGCWFGVDGLLRFLNPFRKRRDAAPAVPGAQRHSPQPPVQTAKA